MPKIKTIIVVIICLVVLGVVGLGLIGYYSKEKKPTAPAETEKPAIQVTSFIGKIVELGDGFIKIQASTKQNQGIEEDNVILKVLISQETKFIEKDEILKTKKDIAFADLKIGDQIIATTQENIAWQKEFTAQYILRIEL